MARRAHTALLLLAVLALAASAAALERGSKKQSPVKGNAEQGVAHAFKHVGVVLRAIRNFIIAILQAINPCLPTGVVDCAALCPACADAAGAVGEWLAGVDGGLRRLPGHVGRLVGKIGRGVGVVVGKVLKKIAGLPGAVAGSFKGAPKEDTFVDPRGKTEWGKADPLLAAKRDAEAKQRAAEKRAADEKARAEEEARKAAEEAAAAKKAEELAELQRMKAAAEKAQHDVEELERKLKEHTAHEESQEPTE